MNRQAGPSIVLSVFIVCFFAVALFRHDPKRPSADDAGKHALRETPDSRPSSGPPQTGVRGRLTAAATAGPPRAAADPVSESALHDGQVPFRNSEPPSGTIRPASVRSVSEIARSLPVNDDAIEKPQERRVAHQPRSAFTVVERDETIGDVAVRIYGSIDARDVLWRANRDLLPSKDSPLSPGTFLRTPSVR